MEIQQKNNNRKNSLSAQHQARSVSHVTFIALASFEFQMKETAECLKCWSFTV